MPFGHSFGTAEAGALRKMQSKFRTLVRAEDGNPVFAINPNRQKGKEYQVNAPIVRWQNLLLMISSAARCRFQLRMIALQLGHTSATEGRHGRQCVHRLSPNSNTYNNLRNTLFARQQTQAAFGLYNCEIFR